MFYILCVAFVLLGSVLPTGGQNLLGNRTASLQLSERCHVQASDQDTVDMINNLLSSGTRLLYFRLHFQGDVTGAIEMQGHNSTYLYRPTSWARARGRYGTGILILKKRLMVLSMTPLNIGVEDVHLNLTQSPERCLSQLKPIEYEATIRDFLLHNLQGPQTNVNRTSLKESERICNMHMRRQSGNHADFYFDCCQIKENGEIVCEELKIEITMLVLLACVMMANVLVIMYAPMIIPESYFKEKFLALTYEHNLQKPLSIIVKKQDILQRSSETSNTISLSKVNNNAMPNFSKALKKMKKGRRYRLKINKIEFQVKTDRLVGNGEAPVGILSSLYQSLVLCKIRHKTSVAECCNSRCLGFINPTHRVITWHRFLRAMMRLLFAFFLCTPWIARLLIYFVFEDDESNHRRYHARAHGMIAPYTGNFLTYLTPLHAIFLICYIILMLDGVVLGVLSKNVARTLRIIIRRCFRDMHQGSRAKALGWCVRLLLKTFTKFGICGFLIVPFHLIIALPICLLVMAFYVLPTLNIIVRLFLHLIAYSISYNKESCLWKITKKLKVVYECLELKDLLAKEVLERPQKISMRYRIVQLVVIMICLGSVMSFVILLMECIVFFVEYLIFTVIGIILNASFALKYVSVGFMIALYARECFGSVSNKYSSFSSEIHQVVLSRIKANIMKISKQSYEDQKNTAFVIPLQKGKRSETKELLNPEVIIKDVKSTWEPSATDPSLGDLVITDGLHLRWRMTKDVGNNIANPSLVIKEGIPKWNTSQLIVFLDRSDCTYITEKFFSDTVKMPHSGGPGEILANLISAIAQFMVIIVFLLFVVLIVMIFGDEFNVSGFNQTIATLVTGFLPWVFRNILFKPPAALSIDTENINFQNSLEEVIENHKQSWPLADITVDNIEDLDDGVSLQTSDTDASTVTSTSETGLESNSKVDMIINTSRPGIIVNPAEDDNGDEEEKNFITKTV